MAIEPVLQRKGDVYHPFSEEDRQMGYEYPENMPLKSVITGAKKARAYKELCCYKGSCSYIADLNLDDNKNTKEKVDYLTKVKLGFIVGTVYDDTTKQIHWMVDSLSYANCDQPRSHRYIAAALEEHAALAGVDDVDAYVAMLRQL